MRGQWLDRPSACSGRVDLLEDRTLLTTDVTLAGTTLTIADVDGANSTDQLSISFSGGTYTIEDTGGLTIDASSVPGSTGSGTSMVTVPQGTINTVTINTFAGADSIRVQQVPAGTTFNINGGDNTDTINLGTSANSLGGLLGDINVNGDGHDAGTTSLMIRFGTNTLDSGDILNINDQGDADSETYTLGATTFTRSEGGGSIGTVTYGTIETVNLNTAVSGADIDVTGTGNSINTNIVAQNQSDIDITTTGIDSNLTITTGAQNDDVNFATVGGDGGDSGFLSSFNRITTGAGNDIFTQQNAPQNSYFEVNLEAGTDTANVQQAGNAAVIDIRAGDNTDTLNWGNPSNSLDNFAGILTFDGGNHDAGSSSLTIKGETNTLDSGDIVNLFDQGDTDDVGYQFQSPMTLAREGAGGLNHTNTETINVFTTSGVVDFIAFGSSPAINYNLQAQGSNDSFRFFDGFGVGADTNVIINAGGGADDIDIDETGGGDGGAGNATFGAFIQINGEGGNDTFAIDDVQAGDRVELTGGTGDDTFNVTPSLGVINVLGGTPAAPSMPGDTLSFTQPGGETSTLVNQTPDSGTYQTTGGFADVCYDEIESGPPPIPDETEVTLVGNTLTIRDVNGGTSNDNLFVIFNGVQYQINDNNGNTIDVSSIPGSTGSGTNMTTVPAGTIDGLNVTTLGGDDTLIWFNIAAADYSGGGVMIDSGTGNDSMTFSVGMPTNLGNADVTVIPARSASVSGLGPFNFVDGNLTVSGNAAGTAPGSGNGASLGATVNVTGTGDVMVIGRGGALGGSGVVFSGKVSSTGTGPTAGTITLDGQGGPSTAGSVGISMTGPSAFITSVDGDIMITGVGTDGTNSGRYGIHVDDIDRIESTGTGADAATITLNGTAGNGDQDNAGIRLRSSIVRSAAGDVTLTGVGSGTGPTSTFSNGVGLILSTTVQINSGSLVIDGTGGAGTSAGVRLFDSDILSIGTGSVDITAASTGAGPDMLTDFTANVIGGPSSNSPFTINADTIEWTNLQVQSTGDLALIPRTAGTTIGLGGGTGTLNLDDTELGFLVDGFNSITIGDTAAGTGTVDIDTVTFTDPITIAGGTINDAAGTDIAAGTNAVTLQGNVSPGQSPGILTVTGNFAFGTGATYEAEIMGTTPGTQHDQIDVTGTVDINNATLNIDDSGFAATGSETFVLINNDAADAVTGTFNGLPEGTLVTVGGAMFAISYVGGDGNDVVLEALPPETEVTLAAGTLTITDVNGGTSNDNLQLSYAGGTYTLTDFGGLDITTAIAGSTGDLTSTVTFPDTGVTSIVFDTLAGNDVMTVNSVQPSLPAGFTVNDGAGVDRFSLSGDIDTGAGDVSVTVSRNIALNPGSSITTTSGNITLNANTTGTTNGTFDAIFTDFSTVSSTSGTITLDGTGGATSGHGVFLSSSTSLSSMTGGVSITGDGNNDGEGVVVSQSSMVSTAGAAAITINGAPGSGGAFAREGVQLQSGARIVASGSGAINITGTLPAGAGSTNRGVIMLDAGTEVTSQSGDVTITGDASAATVGDNHGILLATNASVRSVSGNVILIGREGSTSGLGLLLTNGLVDSGTGNLTLNLDTATLSGTVPIHGFAGSGDLVIQPNSATTSIGLGGGAGTLNLDDTELALLQDGFNSITIGDKAAGTGTVQIDTATFTDPITIAGGTINDAAGTDIDAGTNAVTLIGQVSPGQSPGILVVTGNFAFGAGATFEAEIMGTTPGTEHDQIAVIGTIDINNATLNVDDTGFTASGNEIILIDNDGTDAVTGTFSGLPEGTLVTIGGQMFPISYVGGDGNDVAFIGKVLVDITRKDANPTTAATVDFDVVFSRDVTNVDPADFDVVTTGSTIANAAVTVSDGGDGDATTWVVTVSGVTVHGTVGLDISGTADVKSNGTMVNLEVQTDETYDVIEDRHEILSLPGRIPGNVTAIFSGVDLILTDDAGDNGVVVTAKANGDIVVAGLGGTTINGQPEFIAFTGVGGVLPDDLRFRGMPGDDLLTVADVSVTNDIIVAMGDGTDAVSVSSVSIGRDLQLRTNDGVGFMDVRDATIARNALFFGSTDAEEVRVESSQVTSVVSVNTLDGADLVVLTELTVDGSTQINSGDGDDSVYVRQSETGALTTTTGQGMDSVLVTDVNVAATLNVPTGTEDDVVDIYDTTATTVVVQTGAGNDVVRMLYSQVADVTNVPFASGNNVLDVQDNTFGGSAFLKTTPGSLTTRIRRNTFEGSAQILGGLGATDVLIDDGGNTFAGSTNINRFEDLTNALVDEPFAALVEQTLGKMIIDDRHGIRSIFGRTPGNVAATFTGPDLILSAFAGDNTISITSNAAGDVIVVGQDGTTVNGLPQFTAFTGVGGVLPDDLRFNGFSGNDLISISNVTTTADIVAAAGSGTDAVLVSNVSTGRDLRSSVVSGDGFLDVEHSIVSRHVLLTGSADSDRVVLTATDVTGVITIGAGDGINETILKSTTSGNSTQITTGSGDDSTLLTDSTFGSTVYVTTNAGNDRVKIQNSSVTLTLSVNTGDNDDVIDLQNIHAMAPTVLMPKLGNDAVRMLNSMFDGNVTVNPPGGDKVIDAQDNIFSAMASLQTTPGNLALRVRRNTFSGPTQLLGGTGADDVLMNDASNTFGGTLNLNRFEDLTNALIDEAFEDLLGLAFP